MQRFYVEVDQRDDGYEYSLMVRGRDDSEEGNYVCEILPGEHELNSGRFRNFRKGTYENRVLVNEIYTGSERLDIEDVITWIGENVDGKWYLQSETLFMHYILLEKAQDAVKMKLCIEGVS